jgi:hypothetical protein
MFKVDIPKLALSASFFTQSLMSFITAGSAITDPYMARLFFFPHMARKTWFTTFLSAIRSGDKAGSQRMSQFI